MAVIPSGYAQLNIAFAGQAQPNGAQVVFGLKLPVGAEITAISDMIEGAIDTANMKDFVDNESKLDYFLLKFGPNATGPQAIRNLDVTGDMGGDGLVPSVAVLARKLTLDGGRAGRGRTYWPFVLASATDDGGNLTGTWRSDYETMLNNFLGAISVGEANLCVLHGEDSPITIPSLINSFSVQSKVATQRRRLRR